MRKILTQHKHDRRDSAEGKRGKQEWHQVRHGMGFRI
jgi:hypothetical protein